MKKFKLLLIEQIIHQESVLTGKHLKIFLKKIGSLPIFSLGYCVLKYSVPKIKFNQRSFLFFTFNLFLDFKKLSILKIKEKKIDDNSYF